MTRLSLLTVSCVALALLVGPPAVAGDVPDGYSEVVVFATNSADLKNDGVRVESGHVIVNGDGSSSEDLVIGKDDTVEGSFAVGLKGGTITSIVVGHSLRLKNGAEVGGDAYYNSVQIDNGAAILGSEITPVALPFFASLPDFRTGAPGTQDVNVSSGDTETLAAGDYADVTVGNNGTLIFSGGVYNLRSLDAGNWPTLHFEAPSEIRIDEGFDAGKEAEIGSAPGAEVKASRIVFFVNGSVGNTVDISMDSAVNANFYAPNGKILIQQDTTATGTFAAKDVVISKGVVLNLSSFFNEPPEPVDDSASVLEGGVVSVLDGGATSVLENDDDPNADDTLTVTTPQVSGPSYGTLVLNADGTFSYAHDGSENHTDAFVYEVCDDGNPVECSTATVTIAVTPVNDPPTLDPIADPAAILEDAGEQTVGLSGIAQGGDAPGFNNETLPAQFPLVVTATSDNTGLIPDPTVTYTSPDGTGSLAYTPVPNQSGSAVITVTVMDQGGTANGGVDSVQQTFTVVVDAVNDAPTIDAITDPAAIDEDEAEQTVALGGITQGGGGESSPSPQFPLTVTATSDNTGLIPDPTVTYTSPDSTGSLAYTPVADQSGSAVITVTVMDSAGTANGGVDTTQESFTVVVNPVNDPPVIDDQSLTTDTQTLIVIDLTGTDIEGDNLSYSLISPFSNPGIGSLTDFEQGPPELPANEARVTFLPSGDGSTGSGNFVYEVCDDGTPPGPECDQATVTITVVAFNPAPIADSQSFPEPFPPANTDPLVAFTLTGSDLPDNGLDFSLVNSPNGTIVGLPAEDVASAPITYAPNSPGSADSIVFQVCDNDAPVKCAFGVITINSSEPINNPPGADDQSIFTNGTTDPVNIILTASDPDVGDTLSFSIIPGTGPNAGNLTGTPPSVIYTPDTADDLEDSFSFEACDDGSPVLCGTGTVRINIPDETENDPPTPQADAIRVDPLGTTTDLFPSGTSLLANDSDPNGHNLTATTTPVSGPTNGNVTLQSDGTFSYTHTNAGTTSDLFVYEVCDDGIPSECSTASVFIEVALAQMQVDVGIVGLGTVASSPSSLGDAIGCPGTCSASFDTADDLPVTLTATADAGYNFAGWTGSSDCSEGILTVAANANCIATFTEVADPGDPVTISVNFAGAGGGSVTSDVGSIDCPATSCSEVFVFGTRVVLSPVPDGSSSFGGWSGTGDCLPDGVLDGTVDATCTATFDPLPEVQHTLTVLFAGDGGGDVTSDDGAIGCTADCSAVFGDGETVILNARPVVGSFFDGYSGDCGTVSGFEAVLVMGADATCTATFNTEQ